jgi:3-oxoacyl-[acyl-carrier-protein] synthase II
MVTCLGDEDATWAALLAGRTGQGPLGVIDPERVNVGTSYEVRDPRLRSRQRPAALLAQVLESVRDSVSPSDERVAVIVATGLGETLTLEKDHLAGTPTPAADLHFGSTVARVLPGAAEVLTISNACAASGYALALGEDLLALDEADAVVVAGTDSVSESMLAMIGLMSPERTQRVQPFDADRLGVLLGEGAAAVVLRRLADYTADAADSDDDGNAKDGRATATATPVLATLRGSTLSCDAHHETAPHGEHIAETLAAAQAAAGITPDDLDLVLAHATGTGLNDPTELAALDGRVGADTVVTGIKGAIGHTSGGAALMSLIVAIRALRAGVTPGVIGLESPIDGTVERGVTPTTRPLRARDRHDPLVRRAQVEAFGFGGVNAVTIIEVAA